MAEGWEQPAAGARHARAPALQHRRGEFICLLCCCLWALIFCILVLVVLLPSPCDTTGSVWCMLGKVWAGLWSRMIFTFLFNIFNCNKNTILIYKNDWCVLSFSNIFLHLYPSLHRLFLLKSFSDILYQVRSAFFFQQSSKYTTVQRDIRNTNLFQTDKLINQLFTPEE